MIIALTGTPGTGKTSVSNILHKNGFNIIDLNKFVLEKNLYTDIDKKRKSKIVDINKLNSFVEKYSNNEVIILEGHISHLLRCIDKVIVLRCHPKFLKNRLSNKKWDIIKIRENIEAEILDIILCESIEIFSEENVFEIDTTRLSIDEVASSIMEIINNNFRFIDKYRSGSIDWSEEILDWF
jgi:adenylate kinase